MPLILDPQNQIEIPEFKSGVRSLLVTFSSQLLLSDTPVLSPTAGYKAYQKRMAFAKKAKANPDAFLNEACILISNIDSVMVSNTVLNQNSTGVPLYRFLLSDNPSERNLLENHADIGYNPVGVTSNRSIFEALAGITQEDYL